MQIRRWGTIQDNKEWRTVEDADKMEDNRCRQEDATRGVCPETRGHSRIGPVGENAGHEVGVSGKHADRGSESVGKYKATSQSLPGTHAVLNPQ